MIGMGDLYQRQIDEDERRAEIEEFREEDEDAQIARWEAREMDGEQGGTR